MSLSDDNRQDIVRMYWSKSESTFDELLAAIDMEKWNMAANRMYYCLFHAVSALLIKDGIPVGSHRGAKQSLGQYYVLTGKISKEDGHFYAQMESLRERADYDVVFKATKEEIMQFLPRVKSLLSTISTFLNK